MCISPEQLTGLYDLNATKLQINEVGHVLSVQKQLELIRFAGQDNRVLECFFDILSSDDVTANHCIRVAKLGNLFYQFLESKERFVLPAREVFVQALLIHDIGKTNHQILKITKKPGSLTEEEKIIVSGHVNIGVDIAKRFDLLSHSEIIGDHHERWDGKGYPNSKSGLDISVGGRIATICDYWDAFRAPRCYKEGWCFDKAMQEIQAGKSSIFDPFVVCEFIKFTQWQQFRTLMEDPDFANSHINCENTQLPLAINPNNVLMLH